MPEFICTPNDFWGAKYAMRGRGHTAELSFDMLREAGSIRLGAQSLTIHKEGWLSGRWTVSAGKGAYLSARKPSAFQRRLLISGAGATYTLQSEGILSRSYRLECSGKSIGDIRHTSLFSRGLRVTTVGQEPDFAVLSFATWLVLLLKRRHRRRNRAGR